MLQVLGIRAEGNFEDEATGRPTRRNMPHFPVPVAEAAEVAQPGARSPPRRGSTRVLLVRRLLGTRAPNRGSTTR